MPKLFIASRDGDWKEIEGAIGVSVMEAIRTSGNEELLAICGGCCSCATCHVYVDPQWRDALTAMSSDENDLLESSEHRNANSRLSCQISFNQDLDGMRISIAPQD